MPVPDLKAKAGLERFVFNNGLRVVVLQDRSTPFVGVVVVSDEGFCSEPEGSTSLAHLFEHLMFQGERRGHLLQRCRAGSRARPPDGRARKKAPQLELIGESELSVVLFRCPGWAAEQYRSWSREL